MSSALSDAIDILQVNPFAHEKVDMGDVVLVIGVFDGMHVGHRALFAEAREAADRQGASLCAVTFDKDPDELFRKDDLSFGKLLTNGERLAMIAGQTNGNVISLPLISEVLAMEPASFLAFLSSIARPCMVFTGTDFRFGAKARGTSGDIERWARSCGCEYVAYELVEEDGAVVSATRIREELREGHVAEAKELLGGRAHSVFGTVVRGRGAGEGFGFATANLDLSQCDVMLPREGVYAAYAVVDGERYPAAVNVGVAKSFEHAAAELEAHLLDFEGDLYGKEVAIEFEEWLRPQRVFEDEEELIATVMGNIEWVREHLGGE